MYLWKFASQGAVGGHIPAPSKTPKATIEETASHPHVSMVV